LRNRFDDILKKKLAGAEVTPPSKLWEHIEQNLPTTSAIRNKCKNLILLWLFIGASIIGAALYRTGKKEKKSAVHSPPSNVHSPKKSGVCSSPSTLLPDKKK
jgi:hypothetical protein